MMVCVVFFQTSLLKERRHSTFTFYTFYHHLHVITYMDAAMLARTVLSLVNGIILVLILFILSRIRMFFITRHFKVQ